MNNVSTISYFNKKRNICMNTSEVNNTRHLNFCTLSVKNSRFMSRMYNNVFTITFRPGWVDVANFTILKHSLWIATSQVLWDIQLWPCRWQDVTLRNPTTAWYVTRQLRNEISHDSRGDFNYHPPIANTTSQKSADR